jgi:excisionase family DNA binding protein
MSNDNDARADSSTGFASGPLSGVPDPSSEAAKLMTVPELATYLRLSQAKIYRMAQAGQVPAIRIGRSWRFQRARIEAWLLQEADRTDATPASS